MSITPVNYSPAFCGKLDSSARKLFSNKIKNINFDSLELGTKKNNSISLSYNVKPKGDVVTTMYVTDSSKITSPYVSVELGKGRMPFDKTLLNLVKKNISKAEAIQKQHT